MHIFILWIFSSPSVIIVIISFLNPESISLSLIQQTIATSGGRQLKYLKLKAPKKNKDIDETHGTFNPSI